MTLKKLKAMPHVANAEKHAGGQYVVTLEKGYTANWLGLNHKSMAAETIKQCAEFAKRAEPARPWMEG